MFLFQPVLNPYLRLHTGLSPHPAAIGRRHEQKPVAGSADIDAAVRALSVTEQWHLMAEMQKMIAEKPDDVHAMLRENQVHTQELKI